MILIFIVLIFVDFCHSNTRFPWRCASCRIGWNRFAHSRTVFVDNAETASGEADMEEVCFDSYEGFSNYVRSYGACGLTLVGSSKLLTGYQSLSNGAHYMLRFHRPNWSLNEEDNNIFSVDKYLKGATSEYRKRVSGRMHFETYRCCSILLYIL